MAHQTPELADRPQAVYENAGAERSSMSLLELIAILAGRKKLIFLVTLLVTVAAATAVQFMRDSYKAQAVILPPQQQQSSLAALAAGALVGSAASQIGIKSPGELYIGMMKSRTVAEGIITHFRLKEVYRKKFLSDTQKALLRNTSFVAGKDSLIVISVEDHDPKRAAGIADAFVEGLYQLTAHLAITGASQRRLFFEQELKTEKDNLSDAEVALTNVQRATGLLIPAGQEGILLGSTARLRAEISSREVALHAAKTYATDENPQVQVLQREIAAMREQLSYLETKDGAKSSFEITAGKLPEAALGYVRKVRDVKYHEALYELLAKQYEAARIDESRQAPLIQVVDRARVPEKKSGPPRRLIVLAAAFLGIVFSSIYASLAHSIKALSSDPKQAASLAAIRSALSFRR